MSYARKKNATSDVYVWSDGQQFYCTDCALGRVDTPPEALVAPSHIEATAKAMLAHLRAHETAGDKVPVAAIERLTRESEETSDRLPINAPGSVQPIEAHGEIAKRLPKPRRN